MRYFTFLFLAVFLIGCNEAANTTAINTTNANTNAANVAVQTANDAPKESAAVNNAPTLAPVVNDYYAALNKKDEAGAKKFLSSSAVKYWDAEGKAENETGFNYLLEAEEPLAEKREVRNEKINGDAATAEMKGGSLGVWTVVGFVKENGAWKFASPKESLALQDIPRTVNTNSAK